MQGIGSFLSKVYKENKVCKRGRGFGVKVYFDFSSYVQVELVGDGLVFGGI